MTDYSSPELKKKFSTLRKQQRKIQERYLLRAGVVSTFASGILAILFFPHWQIKEQSQIRINSDRLIDPLVIQNTLEITYPQSILTIPTQNLKTQLQDIPVFNSVRVTKNIFPPFIDIYIQEKIPVATVIADGKIGFLDSQGTWLNPEFYNYQRANLPITSIKVINFQSQYHQTWSKLYSLITAYPMIDIKEVHWDEMGSLSLVTKNCKVILGSDSSLLNNQFAILASFNDSDNSLQLTNVAQIDLTNPNIPFIKRNSD